MKLISLHMNPSFKPVSITIENPAELVLFTKLVGSLSDDDFENITGTPVVMDGCDSVIFSLFRKLKQECVSQNIKTSSIPVTIEVLK